MRNENSLEYKRKIHNLIPGGAHTYSKGDDQFPENAPSAISHGKGAFVWDIDGNKYLDCSMGLTSVSLGHAYKPVLEAVTQELLKGVNFQRPSYIEKEMAETFLDLVPEHDRIKFSKNGSTVTTAAVKLARAYTGRKFIAIPGDHPFYSYDDWFIGKTLCDKGVPKEISNLTLTFKSCSIDSLKKLFENYPNQIAAIITEPEKPNCSNCNCSISSEEYLKSAINLTQENGAIFILDEMISGFKIDFPGAITKYNLTPDIATWGKGIANGFSFCAMTGKKEIMDLGGILIEGEEKVFLISTTHGGETHSIRAGIKTIEEFKNKNVVQHTKELGKIIIFNTNKIIKKYGLEDFVEVIPCSWMVSFNFKNEQRKACSLHRTLFLQEMIKNNISFQGIFIPSFSHSETEIKLFSVAFEKAIKVYEKALKGDVKKYLVGKPIKAVFRKLI